MKTMDTAVIRQGKPTYLGMLIIQFLVGQTIPWNQMVYINNLELKLAVMLDTREREIRWALAGGLDHCMPAHRN